jgi:simple sugar transport system permease protein
MSQVTLWTAFLQTCVQMGTPLLLATLGGIMCEKAGHLNLGIEGLMLLGAVSAFAVALSTGSLVLAILAAGIAGMGGCLIYGFVTITLRGNHVVTGLALTIFGTGLSGYLGKPLTGINLPLSIEKAVAAIKIPLLSDIPVIGPVLFNQSIFIYLGILAAVVLYVYYYKTQMGLNVRSVGENPAAADASGINVTLVKYANVLAGGFLCGVAGAYLSLVFVPRWQEGMTAGIGWIAVALIIFSTWKPMRAIFGAYFFGFLRALVYKIQNVNIALFGLNFSIPAQFLGMLPYAMTIVALVIISFRKRPENQAPKSLGSMYHREER